MYLMCLTIVCRPREESRKAVQEAHEAGISVHMLTGDHEATAVAIAKELRILNEKEMSSQQINSLVTTGPKFDALADEEVDSLPALPLVVARCSPETKVKMIQASHRRRDIAAMTGDGVNDSPSLRIADVGISMGKNGSDVAKQASDIILTDDNFATIIRAISEGRRIYQNMQRFLLYYWIALAACALVILVNLVVRDSAGNPVAPFSTIQMIWFYVIISPPAAALSVQKASPTVMKEPPRPPTESVFNREIILDTFVYAIVWAAILLGAFYIVLFGAGNGVDAINCDVTYTDGCYALYRGRSVMIITFTYTSLVTAIHCRSYRRPEWSLRGIKETWKSTTMMGTLVFDTVGLLIFVYVPKVNVQGFRQLNISWEWGLCIAAILLWIAFGEFFKLLKRQFLKPLSTGAKAPTV
jgi:potassium/sodium efflux P-type ATPase